MALREGSVWPKLLAAFAGGIVCMSLLPEIGGTTPAPEPGATLVKASPPAVAEAPQPVAERPDSKPIRVITTDRTASSPPAATSTAMPDKPRAAPGRTAPRRAGGDTASLPQESVEDAGPPASAAATAAPASPTPGPGSAAAVSALPVAGPSVSGQTSASPPELGTASVKAPPGAETPPTQPAGGTTGTIAESTAATPSPPAIEIPALPPVVAAPAAKAKSKARVRAAEAERRARAQRRLTEQEEFTDAQGTRLRTLRLLDGRLVTVRAPEVRGRRYFDEADLPPPPPYARYRRARPDSTMSWLDPPGY